VAQADAERVRLAGQAQADVVEVTAVATAKQTTLEGNAEAGIVMSKGEAEAKALALRAEAYRQFNEAAIIQTVLSMLPEIVRAAAEPMANIDNLTVLSNDGASDVVKNVTRTVTEAGATVKGLTGIDIPAMLSQAMGGAANGGGQPRAPSGGGGGGRSRPSAPRGGGAKESPGGAASGGGAAMDATATDAIPASPPVERRPATPQPPASPAGGGISAGAGDFTPVVSPSTGATPAAPPRFETQEQIDSALAEADRALRVASARTPRTDTAAGPARPASLEVTRETTVDDAARRLAADLRAVPGIERFATVRLTQLDRSGPRPLRTMWRLAREGLDERIGQMTIGELIDTYGADDPAG
jgi:flotillin